MPGAYPSDLCVSRPTDAADAQHMGGVKRVPCRHAFASYVWQVRRFIYCDTFCRSDVLQITESALCLRLLWLKALISAVQFARQGQAVIV